MAGVRSLNVNNALVIAKNIANFNALVRVYNVNDVTWASVNNDWTDGIRINEDLGYDSIWGLNDLNSGDTINFFTYSFGGPVSFGYHIFRNNQEVATDFGGVSNIAGIDNNATKLAGWYAGFGYHY